MTIVSLVPTDANQNIVDLLEAWLAMAKRGEITDLVAVGVGSAEEAGYLLNATIYDDQMRLLGTIEYAKFKVLHRQFEDG